MTLLVVSPDYASHLLPLATLATAWRDAGQRVVVATGPATAAIVRGFGYEHVELSLGRGSNPGVIRPEEQPPGEDASLRGFFDATRRGMLATLRYQADARADDLLWQPVATARRVLAVLDAVRPDQVVVDHLAFSARIALAAAGVRYADVVLGHPSALPVRDEVYGFPPAWPKAFEPDAGALAALRARCVAVADGFTRQWNDALHALAPGAPAVDDAFAAHGDVVLLNYPEELHDPLRGHALPGAAFLGSCVRDDAPDADVARWLDAGEDPVVHVSFGSFLSARADVLARVVEALRPLPARVALATGSADVGALGALPGHWLVRASLPQVAVLRRAAATVSHGGNNSVTEALTFGVPLVTLPFSTDQFAGAAALEDAGLGPVLDPNAASPAHLRNAVETVLAPGSGAAAAARRLGDRLRATPGPSRARTALAG
ncbi:MAG TPA: glycosyltransferase [Kineosporiaceae bacterium]|nr:glycosyltransferase [Kineosporiaceae bacterium]